MDKHLNGGVGGLKILIVMNNVMSKLDNFHRGASSPTSPAVCAATAALDIARPAPTGPPAIKPTAAATPRVTTRPRKEPRMPILVLASFL